MDTGSRETEDLLITRNEFLVIITMPPFEEEGHIALHLSVGMSVGRSVDQTMSAQYLENLSSDCYDISYVGW
jgi:hypothetical protein